jgi:hypothetical protein
MTPIEIIALLMVFLAVIKIVVILHNPAAWWAIPKNLFKHAGLISVGSLALAILVLYYLLQELSIVQVFASVVFTSLLVMSSVAAYSKEFLLFGEKIVKKKNIIRRAWVQLIAWVILMVWVVYVIFW